MSLNLEAVTLALPDWWETSMVEALHAYALHLDGLAPAERALVIEVDRRATAALEQEALFGAPL